MSLDTAGNAWILMMKSDEERSWVANRGYDDSAGIYYSYDSNVANSSNVKVGDLLIVRVDDYVAGWGIAEHIEVTPNAKKLITRCPSCKKTNFYSRENLLPKNRCNGCRAEFSDEDSIVTEESVTAFKCLYANSWVEAVKPLKYTELKSFYATADTFNAMRPVVPGGASEIIERIGAVGFQTPIDFSESLATQIIGGHTEAVVRRRKGQRSFRFKMMDKYGFNCAFSGSQPPQVLEAAHLYSFAKRPEHSLTGGMLLRRDFHTLFDAKLMAVDPSSWKIQVAPSLMEYETYRPFQNVPLKIASNNRPSEELIRDHFEEAEQAFKRSA